MAAAASKPRTLREATMEADMCLAARETEPRPDLSAVARACQTPGQENRAVVSAGPVVFFGPGAPTMEIVSRGSAAPAPGAVRLEGGASRSSASRPAPPLLGRTSPARLADGSRDNARERRLRASLAKAQSGEASTGGNDALFELFGAAITDPSILGQVCKHLLAQLLGPDLLVHRSDVIAIRPTQVLARLISCAIPGIGSALRDPALWRSALGEEREFVGWWSALLARFHLRREGDTIPPEALEELVLYAMCVLRDRYAGPDFLRAQRMVPSGAPRLRDLYGSFEHLALALSKGRCMLRCRSLLAKEDRLCSQLRKDKLAAWPAQLRSELELLRHIEHPALPRIHEFFEDFNNIYLISELWDSISLPAFLKERYETEQSITEVWVSHAFRQVLDVLQYLHGLQPRCLAHGALGMASVLVRRFVGSDSAPVVAIVDLGLAAILPSPPPPRAKPRPGDGEIFSGALRWSCSEVADLRRDVLDCGALLLLVLVGRRPLDGDSVDLAASAAAAAAAAASAQASSAKRASRSGSRRTSEVTLSEAMDGFFHLSTAAKSLCAQMLEPDAERRPSAAECLRHSWFEVDAPWSEPLPLPVLAGAVDVHERVVLRQEVAARVVRELSAGPLSCGGAVFSALAELGAGVPSAAGEGAEACTPFGVHFYLQDAKYGRYVVAGGGEASCDGAQLHFTVGKDPGRDQRRMQFVSEFVDEHRFYLRDAKLGRYVQPQGGLACKNGVELQFHAGKDSGPDAVRMQFVREADADGKFYLKDAKFGRYVHPRGGQADNNEVALVFWSGKDSGSDCTRMQFMAEYEVSHVAERLQQMGLQVATLDLIACAFSDPDESALDCINLCLLAEGCADAAEEQLDRNLWRVFQAAGEDHSGTLGAAQFEQVLDGSLMAVGDTFSPPPSEGNSSCQRLRAALDLDPELTASEVVRHIAQGGREITVEALKDFVVARRTRPRPRDATTIVGGEGWKFAGPQLT